MIFWTYIYKKIFKNFSINFVNKWLLLNILARYDNYRLILIFEKVFNIIEKEYYKDSTREKYIKHLSELVNNETLNTAAIESAAANIRNILEYYYNESQKILNNDFYNAIEKLSDKISG